ncbi:hypothetical protein pb186bvf_020793 [Paramecium bursaria]
MFKLSHFKERQTPTQEKKNDFTNIIQQAKNKELLNDIKVNRNEIQSKMHQSMMNKNIALSIYSPLLVQTLIYLLVSFILSILIFQKLQLGSFYEELSDAESVISNLQRQVKQQVIQNVSVEKNCSKSLGYIPGTDKGCVCPNMQTSNSWCQSPCKDVKNIPSFKFYKFQNQQLCISYKEQNGTNQIKFVDNGGVKVGSKQFILYRDEDNDEGEFYKFVIAPGKPCFNPKRGQVKKSQLSYPFMEIEYIGCDEYGSYNSSAVEIGKISHGQLVDENDVDKSQYPFWEKYFKDDDDMYLYLLRKHFVDQAHECQDAFDYPFKEAYGSCLLIQVTQLIVCYFGFIFFGLGAIFMIGALLLKKAPKIKNKVTLKTPLPQVMEKSIILLGITMSICVLFTQIIYQYGVGNELGLSTSAQYSGKLLQKPCFKSNGILKAVTMINTVIKDCTNDIYIPVMIWDIFAVLHLIIGYFTIRKIIEKS